MHFLTETSGPPLRAPLPASWMFDKLEEWATRFPDRFAFALDDQGSVREYRYADVLAEANAVAAGLVAAGVLPGDRVGILMENIPQWAFVLLGAMRMGAVTVPLATALPETHLERIVVHSGCRMIFADDANLETACRLGGHHNIRVIALSDWPDFLVPDSASRLLPPADTEATALIIYTSGTTGDPKGVQLTIANLNYEISGIVEPLEMASDHRILSVLPFSHVLPLVANALGPLCVGAGVVFLSSISPQRITEAFHKHRITCFICVPQFFYLLHKKIFAQVEAQPWLARKAFAVLRQVGRAAGNVELRRRLFKRIHRTIGPELRLFASGGSRFDARVAEDLSELGYTVVNAYGLTETSAAATVTPVSANRIGTVGKPFRGVSVRIDAPNHEGVGEVWLRGPLLMKGYYRDEARTAEALRDGWFHTGDLGFLDRDGNLTITGRSKDVIVLASGKNVYPEEVETHYGKSSFIKEVCVLGVVGEAGHGERLHAIVVPDMDEFRRRGQSAIMEMIRFEMENLSRDLPSYQRVLSLSIRNEALPRTVTRKLKRFEIEKQEKQRVESAGERARTPDHARFQSGFGAAVAEMIRKEKPDTGGLDPSLNIELDLGFDSLARVELLNEIEARTGAHIDEEAATRIYTLGELLDALETNTAGVQTAARRWKDILAPSDEWRGHYIFSAKPIATAIIVALARLLFLLSIPLFRLKCRGLENIPRSGPYLMCPNHESFLDAPMLYAVLPARVIAKTFSLGYSDYWQGWLSRRIAESCNIVAIDPNVNLVRAMQAGAAGLKRHKVLLIFPEGTRSIDGSLVDFKKGAAILASELGVPILPVGINGTFESWPRSGGFRFRPIQIVFGRLIDPGRFAAAADPYAELTEYLRQTIRGLTDDKRR
jgi:long-chain acyl-CoA synthetase